MGWIYHPLVRSRARVRVRFRTKAEGRICTHLCGDEAGMYSPLTSRTPPPPHGKFRDSFSRRSIGLSPGEAHLCSPEARRHMPPSRRMVVLFVIPLSAACALIRQSTCSTVSIGTPVAEIFRFRRRWHSRNDGRQGRRRWKTKPDRTSHCTNDRIIRRN